jgi:putative FmdB family regulatory protein
MPIYDFKCTACGHQDEVMRKISDASTMDCPSCKQATFSKMLSAPSFQLNGTGWYATDFKDKPKAPTKIEPEKVAEAPVASTADTGVTATK